MPSSPKARGTGVGRALLEFAEQEAVRRSFASVYLCMNSKVTENQGFYPRIGYVEYDRKNDGGYDRVFYRKPLAWRRAGACQIETQFNLRRRSLSPNIPRRRL